MDEKYSYDFVKEKFFSGVLCDVLDQMGYRHQFFEKEMVPLFPDTVIYGKCFTAVASQVYSMPKDPLTAQCVALDHIEKGDVFVLTTKGERSCAILGALMATGITTKGGVGAILDGNIRDLKELYEMKFPLVYKGRSPATSKGRAEVYDYQIPIEIYGVTIHPGDYVFADIDGVVIIPGEIKDKVLDRALEVMGRENDVRDELLAGATLSETYKKIGAI